MSLKEDIAKIIDPLAFDRRERYILRAAEEAERAEKISANAQKCLYADRSAFLSTVRRLRDLSAEYQANADLAVKAALEKAEAILEISKERVCI